MWLVVILLFYYFSTSFVIIELFYLNPNNTNKITFSKWESYSTLDICIRELHHKFGGKFKFLCSFPWIYIWPINYHLYIRIRKREEEIEWALWGWRIEFIGGRVLIFLVRQRRQKCWRRRFFFFYLNQRIGQLNFKFNGLFYWYVKKKNYARKTINLRERVIFLLNLMWGSHKKSIVPH